MSISRDGIGENSIAIVIDGKTMTRISITVHDYDADEKKIIKEMIRSNTTEDMSGTEKMRALCEYVRHNYDYFGSERVPEFEEPLILGPFDYVVLLSE